MELLLRATDLKEQIIERRKVEAVAAPDIPRLLGKLHSCGCEALVGLIDLLACLHEKADVETFWIWRQFIAKCARVAQNKRKAMSIAHDGDGILSLFQALEIEVVLEKGACFGEVVHAEIEVVELHKILLRWEVRCAGSAIATLHASNLGKATDALHLLLSWVRAFVRRTVTLSGVRATGLPTGPAFFDDGIITHHCLQINCSQCKYCLL